MACVGLPEGFRGRVAFHAAKVDRLKGQKGQGSASRSRDTAD
jgi:hypothetical protein